MIWYKFIEGHKLLSWPKFCHFLLWSLSEYSLTFICPWTTYSVLIRILAGYLFFKPKPPLISGQTSFPYLSHLSLHLAFIRSVAESIWLESLWFSRFILGIFYSLTHACAPDCQLSFSYWRVFIPVVNLLE